MRGWYLRSMTTVAIAAAAVGAVISMSMTQTQGQAQQAARPATVGGKPNFSGIWQANNEANWDLQAHAARPAAVTQEFTRQSEQGNRIYYEPRCNEGNYAHPGLLRGARMQEAAFAEGRGPNPATRDSATGISGAEEDPLQ